MTTTTSTSRRSSSSTSRVEVVCSTRADGDFHPFRVAPSTLTRRQRALVDRPWAMSDQRHGVGVARVAGGDVTAPSDVVADVLVTGLSDIALAIWAADCAPVVLIGEEREFAVAHAGWRGLAAGVVDAAVDAMTERVAAIVLGPTIGPCCYEFGADDLEAVAAGVHVAPEQIRGVTATGELALDPAAAVAAAAAHHGVSVEQLGGCTGCRYDGFSHRVRRDPERHVVAAYRTEVAA